MNVSTPSPTSDAPVSRSVEPGYREVFALLGGLLVGLLTLQVWRSPAIPLLSPISAGFGIFFPLTLAYSIGFLFYRNSWVRFLSGTPFAISSLALTSLAALCGTLVFQNPGPEEIAKLGTTWTLLQRLGLTDLYRSPWFGALVVSLVLCLVLAAGRRSREMNGRALVFLLTHGGLALTLAGGLYGNLTAQVGHLEVEEGTDSKLVRLDQGSTVQLPSAVHLERFQVEPFPLEVCLAEWRGDNLIPKSSGRALPSLEAGKSVTLGGWTVRCETVLPNAEAEWNKVSDPQQTMNPPVEVTWKTSESLSSHPMGAAKLVATKDDLVRKGWVVSGPEGSATLSLEGNQVLMVLPPQPKAFRSELVLDGKHTTLRVNGPVDFHGWTLNQASFSISDSGHAISILKIVKDPSTPIVIAGLTLLLLGVLAALWILPGNAFRGAND